jgi:hypothetical protein
MGSASSLPSPAGGQLVCRKSGLPRPVLEMCSARGKELYMRVGVTTTELGGEVVHLVQLEK